MALLFSRWAVLDAYKQVKTLIKNLEKEMQCLKGRRNKFYAHNDKKYSSNIPRLIQKNPLSYNDIELFIHTAGKILNLLLGDLTGEVFLTYYSN